MIDAIISFLLLEFLGAYRMSVIYGVIILTVLIYLVSSIFFTVKAKKAGTYANLRAKAVQDGMKKAKSLNDKIPDGTKSNPVGGTPAPRPGIHLKWRAPV